MSQTIATIGFGVMAAIILLFALMVLWKIYNNDIKINDLLNETPPAGSPTMEAKASLSRFQFLVFTFVIAGLFLLLSIEAGTFVEVPQNVLILLGISGGSYIASKTINASEKNKDAAPNGDTKKDGAPSPEPKRPRGSGGERPKEG
jgi:hypothetical protein